MFGYVICSFLPGINGAVMIPGGLFARYHLSRQVIFPAEFTLTIKYTLLKQQIMRNKLRFCFHALMVAMVLNSCKKAEKTYETNFPNAADTMGILKDATDIPLGVAIDYSPTVGNATYMNVIKREFDGVTFAYNMKHGALVQDNGTINFTTADAMVNACGTGIDIFGHTLGWHENQNAGYLKTFAGIIAGAGPDIVLNGGFESGGASSLSNWSVYNSGVPSGSSVISAGSGASEVRTGTRSMKVFNPTAYGGDQWRVQVVGDQFATVIGKQYTISYWVKALAPAGSIRLSTQTGGGGSAQYQGDQTIGTAWQNVTWTINANSPLTSVAFDMGQAANTYFVDDVTVKEQSVVAGGPQIAAKLDIALGDYVTGMINHFKSRVRSWDVVNEVLDNSGNIRNNANSPNLGNASDYFVWGEYLGRDFALKAFNYAKAADPTAALYINDYGLESNPAKLDSLIKYVAELKGKGAKIDGIGTQMHIDFTTKHAGIDNMLQKLAATGLKIRISELDVRTNVNGLSPYALTPLDAYGQEQMYKYVITAYKKYIPKAQQAGITVWGLTDNSSWLYNNGKEFPLLFKGDFSKKTTYAAAIAAYKAP
jgi:endo-1,4-beta-xylanase